MRLLTLGGLELRGPDGRAVTSVLSQKKRLALLCYLAVREPGSFVQRHAAASMFWPESTEVRARSALRNSIHYLRSVLGSDAIISRGDEEIALNPAVVWCDAVEFERACRAGRHEEALALYRGVACDGFMPGAVPDFTDWLDGRRRALNWLAVDAAKMLADRESERNARAAVPWVQRWLELSPYEEPAIRALVQVLLASGDRARALAAFDAWSDRLARDLNAQPSAETLRLINNVRGSQPVPRAARPPIIEEAGAQLVAPRPPRGKLAWLSAAAIIIVALGVGAFMSTRPPRTAPRTPIVAVLPFTFGGGEQYRYLGSGMVELLSDQLGTTSGVRLVDSRAVLNATGDHTDAVDAARARAVAQRLKATHFVMGSILELNGELQISAALYEQSNSEKPLTVITLKGDVEHLFEVVNRVGAQLMAEALEMENAAPAQSTTSVAATQAFIAGERAYLAGQYTTAAEAFQRSIAHDSTFARAHLALSFTADWLGRSDLQRTEIAAAMRHEQKLAEADRLILHAWDAHIGVRPRPWVADSLYRLVLAREPENAEAQLQLGEVRYHWGPTFGMPMGQAQRAFTRTLELVPTHGGALVHLLRLHARNGRVEEVNALYRRLEAVGVRSDELVEARMLRAAAANDQAAFKQALPDLWSQGTAWNDLAFIAGNAYRPQWFQDAARSFMNREIDAFARIQLRMLIAQLEVARGNYRNATEETRALSLVSRPRAAEVMASIVALPFVGASREQMLAARAALKPYEKYVRALGPAVRHADAPGIYYPRALLLRGLLSERLGDQADVQQVLAILDDLQADTDQPREFGRQYAKLLRARVAFERGDAKGALAALGEPEIERDHNYPDALSFPASYARWTRAEALAQTGQTAAAIRWFSGFPDPAGGDLMFVARAHLRAAQLYEQLGDQQAAVWHARAFLRWASNDAAEMYTDVSYASRLVELVSDLL